VQTLSIVFVILGALSLISAGFFFLVYRIFEYNKDCVAKVTASLTDVQHKNDVPVYGNRFFGAPIREIMRIKNYSKGKYEYQVNRKRYTIHYVEYVSSKQMPKFVSVIYIKWFPKVAYVKTDVNMQSFDAYSIISVLFGVMFLYAGFSMLL